MTLDEMIAFVSDEAADCISASLSYTVWWPGEEHRYQEKAAALINVENALRRMKAMADEASGELA